MLHYFAESKWYTIVLASLFYAVTSWLLLWAAEEQSLTGSIDFLYWLAVTARQLAMVTYHLKPMRVN